MKRYKQILLLLNLVGLLAFVNISIVNKEAILAEGRLCLLELAPADPRSLMQGDYMTLRYKIAEIETLDSIPKRGYCVVQLNSMGIANKVRLQKNKTPLQDKEYLIKYTSGKWNINIGAESFFFQEGQAEKFAEAKYGGIKIDEEGNSLLVGLYDEHLKKL